MLRATFLLLAVCTFAAAGEPAPRLPRDNLLLYRGTDGKPVAVKSVDDWAKRRAEIVRGMESVMGKLPGEAKRCPLDMKIEEEFDGGTYVRRLVTYAAEPGGRALAYLLIPKDVLAGKRKAHAVLCLHGTDNVIGHGSIVIPNAKTNRGYALELAQRGYVTLAPNYPLLAKYQPDLKKLGWESGTLKAVWDNMRGLDLLASLPFVDASNGFGTIGHSLGGHNSIYTAVFDDRLKVVVSSCGFDAYVDYFNGNPKNWDPEKGWCQTRYMRKLADYKGRLADIPFDFHEMIGALAPRHVFISAPTKDSNFRADSVDRIIAAARPIFKLYGHDDRLRVEHPECPHDFPPDMRETAYKLFDAVLGDDFKLEPGFTSLFNGKDLTGWEYGPVPVSKKPIIEKLDGKTATKDNVFSVNDGMIVASGKRIMALYTAKDYSRDFIFKLEFRVGTEKKKDNSGIYIRGPQLQLDAVTEGGLTGVFRKLQRFKPGDWNEIEIAVTGTKAICKCNGEMIGKAMTVPEKGTIGLQSEYGRFEFRRIRIKEMP